MPEVLMSNFMAITMVKMVSDDFVSVGTLDDKSEKTSNRLFTSLR